MWHSRTQPILPLVLFSVYGQHDMFEPPKAPIDKVLVLTYSNVGLDTATAIFAHHADIWFMSAKPFDALLRLSSSVQGANQIEKNAADFVSQSLSCNIDANHLHLVRNQTSQSCKMPRQGMDSPSSSGIDSVQDQVHCMNSLCRQRGIQMIALRDLKLTDLEPVVHLFKYRMKVSPRHLLFCVVAEMMLRRPVCRSVVDFIPKRQ